MIKKKDKKDRELLCQEKPEICFFELNRDTLKEIAKQNEIDEKIRRKRLILI